MHDKSNEYKREKDLKLILILNFMNIMDDFMENGIKRNLGGEGYGE